MRIRALVVVAMLAGAAISIWRGMGREPEPEPLRAEIAGDAAPLEVASEDAMEAAAVPGAYLSIELSTPPVQAYMATLDLDEADLEFEERVTALSREAEYDPWLGRAAREIAFQGAILSASPPEAVLSFILRSSGAPEGSVAQLLLQTSGDDPRVLDDAILGALENAPAGDGQLLVGIGEAATAEDEYERRVVVVVSRRNYQLDQTTRSLSPGEIWKISGRAPRGFRDAHASVLYPDNRIEEIPVVISSRRFELEVYGGQVEGTIWVSIDGMGSDGPGKLLQLQAEVGRPVPRAFEVLVAADEDFVSVSEAEGHAFALLNRDRQALGLPPLVLDAELSAIGRAHSEDMRDHGFFGHLSPTTGLATDRIAAAGYRASGHGENLAFNDSIAEAESSLLESVGHRRNIVATNMDHIGIGLAQAEGPDHHVSWHLTQVFARKVRPLDAELASQSMLDRINEARAEKGINSVIFDPALCDLAKRAATEALSMEIEEVPAAIAPQASAFTQTRVAVSVHVFYELDDLEPDQTSLTPEFARLGMAFVRDADSAHGRTILVMISAE